VETSRRAGPAVAAGVCAIIPARGGSKGVPHKNLRTVGGEPLVARAVRAARAVPGVDAVVVSTDDADIADVAHAAGALVVDRPAHLADDHASSESALRHALEQLGALGRLPAVTVFVQATSPFIGVDDVSRAVDLVRLGECDVAFSVTRADTHLWRNGPDGPEGVNHDAGVRRRRQDREPEFTETGAFYVMRTRGFLDHGHRFFGRIRLVEVDPGDSLEIDTVDDLRLAELLVTTRPAAAAPVPARAVVTDFDGVHTDDRATIDQDGREAVVVHRGDGMGVALLRRAGVPVLILSTETNPVVRARAAKLEVDVIAGCDDKLSALAGWAQARGLDLADVAYLGNDVNDVPCLAAVGWPVVVADAHPLARRASSIVLRRRGGDGAVRELADSVLAATSARPTAAPDERHHHG
jgi:YrbI family 3-deoxy-D-manno-octulosonate 8-phosphate phosphatase